MKLLHAIKIFGLLLIFAFGTSLDCNAQCTFTKAIMSLGAIDSCEWSNNASIGIGFTMA